MWQKKNFDPEAIDRELGYAEDLGFNIMRVWLGNLTWKSDSEAFEVRLEEYLDIFRKHCMGTMIVFFYNCCNPNSKTGPQPEPLLGIHNSQWVLDPSIDWQIESFMGWYAWAWSPSPGQTMVTDTTTYPRLEKYVKDIVSASTNDPAILAWDLYNEPTDSGLGWKSLPLTKRVFRWAREVNPSQPVTIVCWKSNQELNNIIFANSDIITFHTYSPVETVEKLVQTLKQQNRPLVFTVWLNRPRGSTVEGVLPFFFTEKIGCLHCGLFNGKTQNGLPWGHRPGLQSSDEILDTSLKYFHQE